MRIRPLSPAHGINICAWQVDANVWALNRNEREIKFPCLWTLCGRREKFMARMSSGKIRHATANILQVYYRGSRRARNSRISCIALGKELMNFEEFTFFTTYPRWRRNHSVCRSVRTVVIKTSSTRLHSAPPSQQFCIKSHGRRRHYHNSVYIANRISSYESPPRESEQLIQGHSEVIDAVTLGFKSVGYNFNWTWQEKIKLKFLISCR